MGWISVRDYSFTKGDICRVVSYAHTDGGRSDISKWPRVLTRQHVEFERESGVVEELQKSDIGIRWNRHKWCRSR